MTVITELQWASMTAAINNIESPNKFLTRLLYSNSSPQSTEIIEVDTWVRGRTMAPFVTKNSNAVPVDGPSQTKALIEAPNIRIKRTIKPHEVMFGRTPGSVIFPSRGTQNSQIRDHMSKELQPLADDITNRVEWMCAQTLTGTLTYNTDSSFSAGGDAFTIDYNKPAGNTVDVSGAAAWGTSTSDILGDMHAMKRVINTEGHTNVTDGIMSSTAADAFLADTVVQAQLDKRNLTIGEQTFITQFDDDGVIYLGSIGGLRCWEYNRSVIEPATGSSVDMIRAGYVEFVSRSNAAEFVLYYGAIADMDALNGRAWVGERFSKSEVTFDPSVMTALAHSRPLPVPRRPGATYSLKVV